MSSIAYSRLPVPVFSLSWFNSSNDKDADISHVLLPGGGGSTKSGIKNQVMIYSLDEKKEKESGAFDPALFTDGLLEIAGKEHVSSLCVDITRGYIFDNEVYCAVFDQHVVVLKSSYVDGKLSFKKITQFQSDFGEEEGSSITCILITKEGFIITGSDDHKVRVWAIHDLNTEKKSKKETSDKELNWSAKLVHEYSGFFNTISAIDQHPTRPWIMISSRDGTCELYDWKLNSRIFVVPMIPDDVKKSFSLKASYDQSPDNLKKNEKKIEKDLKLKKEIRGCALNCQGNNIYLYYIQCGKRGKTELVKWRITMEASSSKKNSFDFELTFLAKLKVSDVPCTRLAIRRYSEVYFKDTHKPSADISEEEISVMNNEDVLGIGSGDGNIIVVRGLDFKIIHTHPTHQLPVTGLKFSPSFSQSLLASCSADNSLALTKIQQKSSNFFKFLLILLFLIISFILFQKTVTLTEIANEL